MDKPLLVADVVSTWLKMGEDRPTLCFGVDKAHAKSLQKQFERAGIPTAYVNDQTSRLDREAIRKAFQSGDVKVVCNIGVLTTGVDWDVRCIILARPTKSEMLYVQIIGRGLRAAAGKADCLILDHSDTTLRLGFVTDILHDRLDMGRMAIAANAKREERPPPLPKECTACAYLKPAGVHQCPACGWKPERQSTIECADGELVQVRGKPRVATREEKQRFWGGLLWHADSKGYREGWAARQYREKFGVWPRGLFDQPEHPNEDVRKFILAGQIRYAKSRQSAERRGQGNAAA
jgi:superfamily II DNA or RNA helicase